MECEKYVFGGRWEQIVCVCVCVCACAHMRVSVSVHFECGLEREQTVMLMSTTWAPKPFHGLQNSWGAHIVDINPVPGACMWCGECVSDGRWGWRIFVCVWVCGDDCRKRKRVNWHGYILPYVLPFTCLHSDFTDESIASLTKWLRRPPWKWQTQDLIPTSAGIFPGRVIPVTQKLALQWLPGA